VPVTLVDAAPQTLEFTVNGATSTGDTSVTPTPAPVNTGYVTAVTPGAAIDPLTQTTNPGTQTIEFGSTTTTTYTVTVQALDQYGNPVTTVTGSPTITLLMEPGSTRDSFSTNGFSTSASATTVTFGSAGTGTFNLTTNEDGSGTAGNATIAVGPVTASTYFVMLTMGD
jgi:hypothetical protein